MIQDEHSALSPVLTSAQLLHGRSAYAALSFLVRYTNRPFGHQRRYTRRRIMHRAGARRYRPQVCRMARNLVAPGRQRLPNMDVLASTVHRRRPSHWLETGRSTQFSRQPARAHKVQEAQLSPRDRAMRRVS